jgi:hypothetical protein
MMMEDGTYAAEVTFPLSQYPGATQYLSKELGAIKLRPSQVLEKDWSCSSTFTIPYMLYDRESSKRNFNAEGATEHVIQMVKGYAV